jgi:hypothetical protein
MKAENILNHELPQAEAQNHQDKIKYVLNGVTHYYTSDELKAYIAKIYANSNHILSAEVLERYTTSTIEKVNKYNGNPYGDQPAHLQQWYHELEADGYVWIIY